MLAGGWGLTPPEIIAAQLMAGDGGMSATGAATAHETLATTLTAEGVAMGANAAGTASAGWEGLGGTAMIATAMPFVTSLELLGGWVQQSAMSAAAIADAYATARTAIVQLPVIEANRTSRHALMSGVPFTVPQILALDFEYHGHIWPHNASVMSSYEGIVTTIMTELGLPPPPAAPTSNPAGPETQAMALGEAVAHGAASVGMNAGLASVNDATASAQAGTQTAAAPAGAAQSLLSSAPQMLGQIPQMLGQLPQMLGQFPQMLSQFPQMAMGLLGPLTSGLNANPAAELAGLDKANTEVAPLATDASRASVGSGPGLNGTSAMMSSFTRPTSSFNAPGPPKLPTGWSPTPVAAPEVAASAQPMAGGTGGLYGAPPMARDDRGSQGAPPVRTVQLVTAPAPGRGE